MEIDELETSSDSSNTSQTVSTVGYATLIELESGSSEESPQSSNATPSNSQETIGSEIWDELDAYQIPNIDRTVSSEYVRFYTKMSLGRVFFRGYIRPDIETRAKIYRAIDILNLRHKQANFINLNTPYGLVIKHSQCEDTWSFDSEYDELTAWDANDVVFVPKGYDSLQSDKFGWHRRLLNCFVKDCELIARIIMNTECDRYFLFLSFPLPGLYPDVGELWKDYIQGGLTYFIQLSSIYLVPACQIFSFTERLLWIVDGELIYLKVRVKSKRDFQDRLRCLQRSDPVPLLKILLSETLQNENSGFGLLRLIKGDSQKCIPIIGTPWVYADQPIQISSRRNNLEGVSEEEIEAYSQDSFSSMDSYRKAGLIKGPSGKWFSFLELYQGARIDPTNREEFTSEFNAEIDQIFHQIKDGIGEDFLNGFPPRKLEPELIVKSDQDMIDFYLRTEEGDTWIWQIPNMENTIHVPVVESALMIMAAMWANRKLFSNSWFRSDPLLMLNPIALEIFENSYLQAWPLSDDLRAVRIRRDITRLQMIT